MNSPFSGPDIIQEIGGIFSFHRLSEVKAQLRILQRGCGKYYIHSFNFPFSP